MIAWPSDSHNSGQNLTSTGCVPSSYSLDCSRNLEIMIESWLQIAIPVDIKFWPLRFLFVCRSNRGGSTAVYRLGWSVCAQAQIHGDDPLDVLLKILKKRFKVWYLLRRELNILSPGWSGTRRHITQHGIHDRLAIGFPQQWSKLNVHRLRPSSLFVGLFQKPSNHDRELTADSDPNGH